MKELDKTQSFIESCDSSRGLDAESYDDYNAALERQKELAIELGKLDSTRNGLRLNGIFKCKDNTIETSKMKVDAVVSLPEEMYQKFTQNLLTDYDFIRDNIDCMYVDRQDATHCLLVLDGEGNDGVLVDSEGYDYARYVSFLPNARDFVDDNIQTMADEIIREGAAQTKSGSYVLGFDELSERFDTPIDRGNYFGEALTAELKTRDALSDVIADESGIALTFAGQTATERPSLTVRQLMAGNLTDVHLLDNDEEHDLATIVELNPDTLTAQGKADWADVLDAKVESIATGYYGLQVNVSGCSPERLKDFSFMLAGQCPLSDYEKWVNPDDGETFEMKWSDKT